MLCLSGSNSSVERAFSVLTMMLSDKRLKSSHHLLNYRLIIKGNDKYWSEAERSEILRRAVAIYMSKRSRRKRKIDSDTTVTTITTESIEISDDDDSSDDDLN